VAEAARLLLEARRTGRPLRELPERCKPATAADANAIIDAVGAALDETVAGWKIGFLYAPRQQPFLCPLYRSRVFDSPARVPLSLTPSRFVEPEICFRVIRDLPARAAAYSAAEVAAAVVACPSMEIVDTRFDTAYRPLRQMLDDRKMRLEAFADHITTGAFVVGPARPDWQSFDFAAMRVAMRTKGEVLVESTGGHAFVDPFLPCVVLANTLRHRGGLTAGQIMVTGSFTGFFAAPAGEAVTAEFVGFGSAEATFVSGE
jgi:2-keto-4-pentenoate hydratase